MIAGDGFSYNTSSGPVGTRLFIYRDYNDYNNYYINSAGNADSGLQKAAKDIAAGVGKYYSYLIDVVPNIAEWDNDANAYRYTTVDEAKMQRLYTGNLAGFDGGGIYNNAFSYTRKIGRAHV